MEKRTPAVSDTPPRAATSRDVEIFRRLSERQPVESELRGESMSPTLRDRARIRIHPQAPGSRPVPGDVVAFLAGSRITCHRVVHVGRGGAYLITQGDGNWFCDPPVEAGHVAGSVREHWRDGAWRDLQHFSPSVARRAFGFAPLALQRGVLAVSPAAALRLGRFLSWLRMGMRASCRS